MANKVVTSDMPQVQFIDNAQVLGQLIKAKRTGISMTLANCAALCNVGINTLSRIENGNANCTLAAVFSVLHGLGIKLTSPSLPHQGGSAVSDDEWV